jgi:hypothetical protein
MARGTIIALTPVALLPTFLLACAYNPVFVNLYAKHLDSLGFSIPYLAANGAYQRFVGDSAVPGKGEILIWRSSSPA